MLSLNSAFGRPETGLPTGLKQCNPKNPGSAESANPNGNQLFLSKTDHPASSICCDVNASALGVPPSRNSQLSKPWAKQSFCEVNSMQLYFRNKLKIFGIQGK